MIVLPNAQRRAVVDGLTAEDGLLDGVIAKLYQNDYTPTPQSVLADFTVATFAGYASSSAITWGPAFTDSLDQAQAVGSVKQFNCNASTTPNVIYGYYITSGDGATLIFAERFAEPQAINGVGDSVVLVPRFVFGQ